MAGNMDVIETLALNINVSYKGKKNLKDFSDSLTELQPKINDVAPSVQSMSNSINSVSFSNVSNNVKKVSTDIAMVGKAIDSFESNFTRFLNEKEQSQSQSFYESFFGTGKLSFVPFKELTEELYSSKEWANAFNSALKELDGTLSGMSSKEYASRFNEIEQALAQNAIFLKKIGEYDGWKNVIENMYSAKNGADAFTEAIKKLDGTYNQFNQKAHDKKQAEYENLFGNSGGMDSATWDKIKAQNEHASKQRMYEGLFGVGGELDKKQSPKIETKPIINALNNIMDKAKKVGKVLSSVFGKKLHNNLSTSSKGLSQLFRDVMRIAKYRVIRSVIKEITEGFTTGINNAYQWSKSLKGAFADAMDQISTSTLYLRNSIGALLIPIIESVEPIIRKITDYAVEAINAINEMISKLSGREYWVKAKRSVVEYQKAVDEAKSSLMGFDEINKLNDNTEKSDVTNAFDFETVPIEQGELTMSVDFKSNIEDIWNVFQTSWESKGKGVVDAFHSSFKSIKSTIETIGATWVDVFTNGTGQTMLETIYGIISNIFGVVENLSTGFRNAWSENETGKTLVQNVYDVINDALGILEIVTGKTEEWAKMFDFGTYLEIISDFFDDLDKWFKNNTPVIEEFIDLIRFPLYHLVNVTIPMLLVQISSIARYVGTYVAEIMQILTGFKKFWTKLFSGDIAGAIEGLKDVVAAVINGMLQRFLNFFKTIGQILETLGYDGAITQKLANIDINQWDIKPERYATGGFPEDGLFYANHNELVGSFSNGKTAVANNQQITDGIAQASYEGMARALAENSGGGNYTFVAQLNGKTIFEEVVKQNTKDIRSFGVNRLVNV